MEPRDHVLFVCTGNTCRSPMAEVLLRHALAAAPDPVNRLHVASAGLAAYPGDPASPNAERALQRAKLDLTDHRSRRVEPYLLDRTLVLVGMTQNHLTALEDNFRELPPFRSRLREFADADEDLLDPVGGPLDEYEACRDAIVEAIPGLMRFLQSEKVLPSLEQLPKKDSA
ncbi:MAG: low molecular weight protein arginine phosphatase [Opitutales bacterium]